MKYKFLILSAIIIFLTGLTTPTFNQNSIRKIGIAFSSKLFLETEIRDAKVAIDAWAREISKTKNINLEVKSYVYDDLVNIEESIKKNEIQMVVLFSMDYLILRNKVILDPAFMNKTRGSFFEKYILLVNKNSGIKFLNQLRNKKLVLQTSGKGEIAKFWIETVLFKQKLSNADEFFQEIKLFTKESQAILQVFFNQTDACIVSSSAYETISELNPQIKENLFPIIVSSEYVPVIFAFADNINIEDKQIIVSTALNVQKYPAGKQLLLFFKNDGIDSYSGTELKSIEELVKEYNSIKSKSGIKKR